jgi:hypothetical protein
MLPVSLRLVYRITSQGAGLRERGQIIRTTLVESVACIISEGVRIYDLREPNKYTEPLYLF